MACSWRSSGLSTLAIMHSTGLSPRDRSCDRNDQHQTGLRRHPANVAYPRRTARSGTRMLSVNRRVTAFSHRGRKPWSLASACPPRTPSQGHQESTAVTHVACRWVPAGQQLAVQSHDRCPTFQAGHADSLPVFRLFGQLLGVTGCVFNCLTWFGCCALRSCRFSTDRPR